MGRYAKSEQTIDDLKRMIDDCNGVKEILYNDKMKVYKDLLKVDVGHDFVGFLSEGNWPSANGIPNFEIISNESGNFPVAWCYTRGSEEWAVAFILYIGQEGKLRGYIPERGNNFILNGGVKEAVVGSEMPFTADNIGEYWFDYNDMKESVKNRISVKHG